jgi:amino acid adenylation domain-containing protein
LHTLLHDILDWRARYSPDRPAVRTRSTVWTYAELRRRSQAYAEWLRRQGVARGDRVLVNVPHAPETVAVIFAAARLGCLYVVVSDQMPPDRLRQIVSDCEPRVLLTTQEGIGAAPVLDGLTVAVLDALPTEPTGDAEPVPCLSIDPVSLIYTSGSTSVPKAVVSTHDQVLFVAQAIQARLRYREDDVVFCCLPLSFDYGLYQVFLSCLAGAELVLVGPDAAGPSLLKNLDRYAVTVFPLMPPLATVLSALIARANRPPSALRLITSSGATLASQTADQLRFLIPGMALVSMFGLTECKRVAIMEPDGDIGRPGAVGRALPDTEVRIVGADGRSLPPGEVGELVVRGRHVMSGYWRAPELTAQKFRRDEFGQPLLFTGDQCRIDADGYLYFVGRSDDVYKHRGFRVSGAEVEAAALDIPEVRLAAVIAPADGADALLVVSGDTTATDVLKQLSVRLEDYKVPRECQVLDTLPLSANGKVDRRRLAVLVGRGSRENAP